VTPFLGLHLARRIEAAEARNGEECAQAVQRMAGGSAIFAGVDSQLTQAVGMGLHGPVSVEELDRMEAFFRSRGAPPVVDLCPLADPSLVAQLAQRGYRLTEFNNVLVRPLAGIEAAPPSAPVRLAEVREAELWAETVCRGFIERDQLTEDELDVGRIIFRMPSARCWFAFSGDHPVAAGAMSIREGLAILFGDSTVRGFRGAGWQSALIAARVGTATAEGCDLAASAAVPGGISQRNYERNGFRVAYTKAALAGNRLGITRLAPLGDSAP